MTEAPVEVFAALGDPNRHRLLELLGVRGQASASDLADPMMVSRQAVAKHLDVLERAGLVNSHREGRRVLYAVQRAALVGSAAWLTEAATRWDQALAAVKVIAETAAAESVDKPGGESD
jgi:DNA-binding transcriptional ArsR family regulator